MVQICDEVPIGFPYSFSFDETFDPYWREFAGQERLPFERFQTNLVYFAEIFEIQLEGKELGWTRFRS
jgi:hypothetical protein